MGPGEVSPLQRCRLGPEEVSPKWRCKERLTSFNLTQCWPENIKLNLQYKASLN